MSLFIGFVVGSITLAVSSLVFLWLYGSFWTTLLVLFVGGKLLNLVEESNLYSLNHFV